MSDLATVLAHWRADAAALRRTGDARTAELLERCATEAETSAEEWLTWLSEADAILRSGHAKPWFVARREAWRRDGHARQVGRHKWTYRATIIPRRANVVTAAEEGRQAARKLRGVAA